MQAIKKDFKTVKTEKKVFFCTILRISNSQYIRKTYIYDTNHKYK